MYDIRVGALSVFIMSADKDSVKLWIASGNEWVQSCARKAIMWFQSQGLVYDPFPRMKPWTRFTISIKIFPIAPYFFHSSLTGQNSQL